MKRIAVDMDGVLADAYSGFIREHEEEFAEKLNLKDLVGKAEFEAFPNGKEYCLRSGFFKDLPVIEKSQEVLAKLHQKYQVFIVSAAAEFPLSLVDKQAWLTQYFPFVGWKQMVFCGSKEIIKADIMIDDHFKNLDTFVGQTMLFTQPHNQLASPGRHQRVNSWAEIEKLLLP
jgi:5'-nucleotidase